MPIDDGDYFLPLQDQRVFGAGLKRKRVPFVPAESKPAPTQSHPRPGLGDRYLSIVLPPSHEVAEDVDAKNAEQEKQPIEKHEANSDDSLCALCALPLLPDTSSTPMARPHGSLLAHQVCLSHSHPPSHLPRGAVGLKYLSSYGWDPDARRGLGVGGIGIRVPLKGKMKNDTIGLGADGCLNDSVQRHPVVKKRLNAKQIRKLEASEKKKDTRLRDMFYGKDLEAYLGSGDSV